MTTSTDPAHSVSDVFDQSFGDDPEPGGGVDRLHALEIYPAEEVQRHLQSIRESRSEQVSAATIRNVMQDLEYLGLLGSPHISAGRVPTDKGFRAFVEAQGSPITPTKPLPQNWMRISIGRSDFKLVAVVSLWSSEAESYDENEIRAEFVVKGKFLKEHFARIKENREAIEERLGYALTWDSRPEVIQSKAFVRRAANLGDAEGWPELFEWLLARLEDFHGVFAPRVRSLPQSYEVEERESAATEAGRE